MLSCAYLAGLWCFLFMDNEATPDLWFELFCHKLLKRKSFKAIFSKGKGNTLFTHFFRYIENWKLPFSAASPRRGRGDPLSPTPHPECQNIARNIRFMKYSNIQYLYLIRIFVSPVACIARLPPLAPQTAVDSRIEPSEEKVNMRESIVDIKNNMRMSDIQHWESWKGECMWI